MRKQSRRSVCGSREADQHLCFCYTHSTVLKSEISSCVPPHEKNNNLHMGKQRRRSACSYHKANQCLCFRIVHFLNPKFQALSRLMRKTICICENKGSDQLCGNWIVHFLLLNTKFQASSLL